jgi:hypothetical protein
VEGCGEVRGARLTAAARGRLEQEFKLREPPKVYPVLIGHAASPTPY